MFVVIKKNCKSTNSANYFSFKPPHPSLAEFHNEFRRQFTYYSPACINTPLLAWAVLTDIL